MTKTIVKAKDGYGLDVWGNYLALKMDRDEKTGEWVYSSILILRDEVEIEKAKSVLNN